MIINARAYAKINWLLEVGSLREDGYHELSTLFQTIDLYDELTFSLAKDVSLKIIDPNFSANLPIDNKNLVIKAANLLASELDRKQGVSIELKKSIPLGGGLGGGSADAAITLLALNQLWKANLSQEKLLSLAAMLGSDVPFFILGGTAWGKGRGIDIAPQQDLDAPYLLLVNPRQEVATSRVYSEFDRLTNKGQMSTLATYFFTSTETLFAKIKNSLSPMAKAICPQIATIETKLTELGAKAVLMSGSGATVWAAFPSALLLEQAFETLNKCEWLVIKSRTISRNEYQQNILKVISEK